MTDRESGSGDTPIEYIDIEKLSERQWEVVHTSFVDALDSIKKAEDQSERRVQLFLAVLSAAGVAVGLAAKSNPATGHATLWAAFSAAIVVSFVGVLTVARIGSSKQLSYTLKIRIAELGKKIARPESEFQKLLFFNPYSDRWPEKPQQRWWPSDGGLIEVTACTTSVLIGAAWLAFGLAHAFHLIWVIAFVPVFAAISWLGQVALVRQILATDRGWFR